MKVLMETITGRKGIKKFEKREDFGDFMNKNQRKIKKYKILEDNEQKTTRPKIDFTKEEIMDINNQLQGLINKCFELSKEVLGVFFSATKSQEEYSQLLAASKKLLKIIPIIKACMK